MSRPLRIEYPNAWYHVMNRGRHGEKIFLDKKDYDVFLTVLRESSEMYGVRVAAYCLMSNHYHLLLQTPSGNLSRVMRHVNGVYTQRYNRRRNIDGQLFRGRYKSVLVEEDSYLLELLRYIHRNPVCAGLCKSIEDYRWSSHHGYVSAAQKWDWLHKRFLLGMFSDKPTTAKRKYLEFVQKENSIIVTEFFGKKNHPSLLGSQDFIEWVKEKYYQLKKHHEIPQSQQLAPTITEIKQAVVQSYGIEEQSLEQSKRGQTNEPRNIAVYLARKHTGLRLEEIGKEFGLNKYSSVSSIVVRTENQLSQDKRLQKQVEGIRRQLQKSQAKT